MFDGNRSGIAFSDRDALGKLRFMREVFFISLLIRYNLRDWQLWCP